jgi:hypothetical protein
MNNMNATIPKTAIRTYSGALIDFADRDTWRILFPDIINSLPHICRWGGHTRWHYSVAQHSILTKEIASRLWKASGKPAGRELGIVEAACLLHDASEAYMGDMVTPLKKMFPEFKALEMKLQDAIAEAAGLPAGSLSSPEVHEADHQALLLEDYYFRRSGLMIEAPMSLSHLGPKVAKWVPWWNPSSPERKNTGPTIERVSKAYTKALIGALPGRF